jgi:integrase
MHRTSSGGTYRLDRVFRGVGRLAVASGATTKGEFDNRNALLTRLYNKGRLDLLRAIQAHTYTVTEVYAADREDRLEQLTGERAILNRPLWARVEHWVGRPLWGEAAAQYDGPEPGPTRTRYGVSFRALRTRAGLPESATVESLGTVEWVRLKSEWRSAADWNHLRRAVSNFLATELGGGNAKLGVHHAFRLTVMANFPKAAEVERVPDLDIPTFWRIVNQTPEFVRAAYVTIAYLGLRVGEYLRLKDTDLLPATKQVRVPGTKTAGSSATLPVAPEMWEWVRRAVPAPVQYTWLHLYWYRARKAVGAGDVRIHDLRHLTAMVLTEAGRSEASVQTTMRHASPDMTRRYARQRDKGQNAKVMAEVLLASA